MSNTKVDQPTRTEGGRSQDAIAMLDRSGGAVTRRLGMIGVHLHALYTFQETIGQIVPAA